MQQEQLDSRRRSNAAMSRRSLVHGPRGERTIHLCVDMQNMFALDTPWRVDWLPQVLPAVRWSSRRCGRQGRLFAFGAPELVQLLRRRNADCVVITGAETDVCVLAAVLGAVDHCYRIVLPVDAMCSASDRTHGALLTLYRERFNQHIETTDTATVVENWH
jgi:nicotinamidase-related amidase